MSWILIIIFGGVIGWLASIVMRTDAQQGIFLNIIVGIIGAFIGGNRRFNINNELYVPVPGANADRTLRIFLYADAGNVWGENEDLKLNSLRASAGLGVSWVSPVGPLKLSYGTPVRKKPEDRIQRLQFQIGTAF